MVRAWYFLVDPPRHSRMAKDLAEEQCCMAQRCGTQATKEHWGQIICDLELTRFSTIETERERVQSAFFVHSTSCITLCIHLYQYRELFSSFCFSFSLHLESVTSIHKPYFICALPTLSFNFAVLLSCRTVHAQVRSGNRQVSRMSGSQWPQETWMRYIAREKNKRMWEQNAAEVFLLICHRRFGKAWRKSPREHGNSGRRSTSGHFGLIFTAFGLLEVSGFLIAIVADVFFIKLAAKSQLSSEFGLRQRRSCVCQRPDNQRIRESFWHGNGNAWQYLSQPVRTVRTCLKFHRTMWAKEAKAFPLWVSSTTPSHAFSTPKKPSSSCTEQSAFDKLRLRFNGFRELLISACWTGFSWSSRQTYS